MRSSVSLAFHWAMHVAMPSAPTRSSASAISPPVIWSFPAGIVATLCAARGEGPRSAHREPVSELQRAGAC